MGHAKNNGLPVILPLDPDYLLWDPAQRKQLRRGQVLVNDLTVSPYFLEVLNDDRSPTPDAPLMAVEQSRASL